MSFTRVHSVKVNKSYRTVTIYHQNIWLLFFLVSTSTKSFFARSHFFHSKTNLVFWNLVEMKSCVNLYYYIFLITYIFRWKSFQQTAWAVFWTEGSRICFLGSGKDIWFGKMERNHPKIIANDNCELFRFLFILWTILTDCHSVSHTRLCIKDLTNETASFLITGWSW